ncbi:hypothetical protein [Propionivibrio sp.]|uniref:hypothetical protein n=1 Tax=Propionivibrio sp. TaxID=2212460 RepID=UPI002600041B|nr:hypothetical protein [Propionivibrio sp.]MBK7357451.1 hypothetical protein [Propionivibrio sp.]
MNAPLTQTQADALNLAILAVQRYAAMHPRPSSVVQKDAAQMLGISGATFSRLVRSGRVTLNAVGRVPITEVDRLLAAPRLTPGQSAVDRERYGNCDDRVCRKLMKRCQIGTRNYNEANDLHAECYGTIGALVQERDTLRTGDTCAGQCEGAAYRIEPRRHRKERAMIYLKEPWKFVVRKIH